MVCSKGYEFSVLLSIPLDYALYLLPEAQRGHAGVVVGYHFSGHTVHYEFGEFTWDLLHQIVFRIVKGLGVISEVLIHSSGVGPVDLRFFEKKEVRSEFVLDELFDVRVGRRLLRQELVAGESYDLKTFVSKLSV
jgi:hypothetical protein